MTIGIGSEFYFKGVVGQSLSVGKMFKLVQKVTGLTTSVLITGESGTGKEMIARAIHSNGPRRDQPFVLVNCGATLEALAESELFGHVRGAFTDAISSHDGLLKRADGGTIFLNAVDQLPGHLQANLLRVLKERIFTPVGGAHEIKVDVRVISATNQALKNKVAIGRFRQDLYYRLSVVEIALLPLRNRKDDIPQLTTHFVCKYAEALGKKVEEISSDAMICLMNYSYPGNIAELETIVEHAVALTDKRVIDTDDLPPSIRGVNIQDELDIFEETIPGKPGSFAIRDASLDDDLAIHEKCLLLAALKKANGVQKDAAELLGINYRSFRLDWRNMDC